MLKHLIIFVLLCGGGYYYWTTRPVTYGPGVVAPDKPVQEAAFNIDKIHYKNFDIETKAKIKLEARVLSIEHYYFDKYADLTPTDIVFGWGPMSDEANLNALMVRQSERDYSFEIIKPPIQQQKMWRSTANMHLIGSTQEVRNQLNSVRKGQILRIKGYLINAQSPDGWTMKTSLTRDDIGKDASELVWINSLQIL